MDDIEGSNTTGAVASDTSTPSPQKSDTVRVVVGGNVTPQVDILEKNEPRTIHGDVADNSEGSRPARAKDDAQVEKQPTQETALSVTISYQVLYQGRLVTVSIESVGDSGSNTYAGMRQTFPCFRCGGEHQGVLAPSAHVRPSLDWTNVSRVGRRLVRTGGVQVAIWTALPLVVQWVYNQISGATGQPLTSL